MNTMNPYVIFALAALVILAGFLFVKYTDWKEKHNAAISE